MTAELTASEDRFYEQFTTALYSVDDVLKVSEAQRLRAKDIAKQSSKVAALACMTQLGAACSGDRRIVVGGSLGPPARAATPASLSSSDASLTELDVTPDMNHGRSMSLPAANPQTGTDTRPGSGWLLFLALYAALTVWIFVGREVVTEHVFTGLKNSGYVVLAVVGIWLFRGGFARSWRMTKQRPLLAAGAILLGLALMGVASAASYVVTLAVATPSVGENQAAISAEVLVASSSVVGGLLFVGVGGIVAPVVEELTFREIPFARLRRLLSTRTAFVLSCLVFGIIHVRGIDEWPLAILYVGFSAALATAYLTSKRNLLVSITAHVLWNGTGLAYLLLAAA